MESSPAKLASNNNTLPVGIRWMIRKDMGSVLDIENESTAFGEKWTDDDLINILRRRTVIGMVAEHNAHVVGFMVFELRKKSIHVLNIAVDHFHKRRGVGSQMTDQLKEKLAPTSSRTVLTIDVHERNIEAQVFFRSQGFKCVGLAEYDETRDGDDDSYLFQFEAKAEKDSL